MESRLLRWLERRCSLWEATNDVCVLKSYREQALKSCKHIKILGPSVNPFRGLRPFVDPREALGVFRQNDMITWLSSYEGDKEQGV